MDEVVITITINGTTVSIYDTELSGSKDLDDLIVELTNIVGERPLRKRTR